MLRWAEESVGNSLTDILLSVSDYSEQKFATKTMLASYSHLTASLKTIDDIAQRLEEIRKPIDAMEGHQGKYIQAIHQSLCCFTQVLQGDELPYEQRLARMQQLPSTMITEEKINDLSEKIDQRLTDRKYKGTVGEKIRTWLHDTSIKPQEVTSFAKQYLGRAKQDTLQRVIMLPEEDGIDEVHGVSGVFWSGYSKYDGQYRGTLHFNLDRPWSIPTFVNILCHEGYPGHQAFYCRWDYLYQHNKWPIEAAYYAYNTPTNALFEGGPELGLHALGWDDMEVETPEISNDLKQMFQLGRDILDLQRMYQTNSCYMANLHGEAKQSCVSYMTNSGILTEVEAQNAYTFFTHPVQCTYYPGYYYGRWVVLEAYKRFARDQKDQFFHMIYDTPQTMDTFIEAVSKKTGPFQPF